MECFSEKKIYSKLTTSSPNHEGVWMNIKIFNYYTDIATILKQPKRIVQRLDGMHDKHQVTEEPCKSKGLRTVLKPSQGGDSLA